jgi:DNA-binding transcriptional LysR family regulator
MDAKPAAPRTKRDEGPRDEGPRWDDLRLLLAVVDERSFLAAGRTLGLATSTLSRRLSALERQIDRKLLERRHDGVHPTEAGQAVAEAARELEARLLARLRALPGPGGALTGTVRLSCGDGFTAVLVEALTAFRRLHPGVIVELAVEPRLVDVAAGQADLALRTTRTAEASVVYQQLGLLEFGLFAAPEYLRLRGAPRSAAALAEHDFVGFTGALARLPPFQALRALGAARFGFRADQFTAYAAGVRAASGLGAMPLIDSDGVERLLPRTPLPSLPVYLCWRRDARDLPAVQALKDFVVDKLRAKLG